MFPRPAREEACNIRPASSSVLGGGRQSLDRPFDPTLARSGLSVVALVARVAREAHCTDGRSAEDSGRLTQTAARCRQHLDHVPAAPIQLELIPQLEHSSDRHFDHAVLRILENGNSLDECARGLHSLSIGRISSTVETLASPRISSRRRCVEKQLQVLGRPRVSSSAGGTGLLVADGGWAAVANSPPIARLLVRRPPIDRPRRPRASAQPFSVSSSVSLRLRGGRRFASSWWLGLRHVQAGAAQASARWS